MGLGDKLSGLTSKFKRKSLDEKIDEVLGSANARQEARQSFSSTFSQLNAQAADKFRSEVSGIGRALFTRAEERFDANYPAIERAPFGDASEEGPLTRNFDEFPQQSFEAIEVESAREKHVHENPFLSSATSIPESPRDEKVQPSSIMKDRFSRPSPSLESNAFSAKATGNYYVSPQTSTRNFNNLDLNAIMKELQVIREQNAVILERLKRIEEKLNRPY